MSVNNTTIPGWGGLPGEIRTQIYRLLFIADGPITPGQPINLSAQILRCNKSIYDEAHSFLWHNVFDISDAKVSQLIFDISNPEKGSLELESSPKHVPIILWSRKVRHVQIYSQSGYIFGYYFDSTMRTLSAMPKLESFCMTIWETTGVDGWHSGGPYWTKNGLTALYEPRGLTKLFLDLVVENFMKQYPSVELYLAMTTLQGKILRWQAQRTIIAEHGLSITFIDRTPKQELLVHASRSSLGPPTKKLTMDGPVVI